MAKNLLDFLTEHPVDEITETFTLSDRIPYKFKIRAFTNEEIENFRKRSNMKIKAKTKDVNIDMKKLKEIVCVECTIEPAFNDKEALKKLNCTTGREFLNKVLAGGEIDTLYERICVLSGYGRDINEEIEEAKN